MEAGVEVGFDHAQAGQQVGQRQGHPPPVQLFHAQRRRHSFRPVEPDTAVCPRRPLPEQPIASRQQQPQVAFVVEAERGSGVGQVGDGRFDVVNSKAHA
jgi:hypothetical protein